MKIPNANTQMSIRRIPQGSNLLLLLCCIFASGSMPAQPATYPSITLIFEAPPENGYFRIGNEGPYTNPLYDLAYYADDYQLRKIELNHDRASDTVVITVARREIEIQHNYRALGKIPFFVQAGDTVLFRYEGQLPFAEVKNRDVPDGELNYAAAVRKRLWGGDFSAAEKAEWLIFFMDKNRPQFSLKEQIPLQTREYNEKEMISLEAESHFLDSLYAAHNMSEQAYRHYKDQMELRRIDLSLQLIDSYFPPDSLFTRYETSSVFASAFRNTLDQYISQKMVSRVPHITSPGAKYADYRALFDLLLATDDIQGVAREILLYETMEKIIQHFSAQDAFTYIKKYQEVAAGHLDAGALVEKYRLAGGISAHMTVQDPSGNEWDFEALLAQHKGKVVYIDFWASWCRPCIAAFPAAEVLKETYRESDIVFLYLSLDDSEASWQKATQQYGLLSHSYRVANKRTSQLLEALAVKEIPRYLLYDKTGALVHRNAPGPGGEEIGRLLEGYVGE